MFKMFEIYCRYIYHLVTHCIQVDHHQHQQLHHVQNILLCSFLQWLLISNNFWTLFTQKFLCTVSCKRIGTLELWSPCTHQAAALISFVNTGQPKLECPNLLAPYCTQLIKIWVDSLKFSIQCSECHMWLWFEYLLLTNDTSQVIVSGSPVAVSLSCIEYAR